MIFIALFVHDLRCVRVLRENCAFYIVLVCEVFQLRNTFKGFLCFQALFCFCLEDYVTVFAYFK